MADKRHEAAEGSESGTNVLLCVFCGDETQNVFNIELKKTHICENCVNAIIMQQVKDLVHKGE